MLAAMAVCWLMPALAQAETVTIGPPMTNAGVEESCPTEASAGETFPDCAYVNSAEPSGVIAQAPADGTIKTWRIDGFLGQAKLLVLAATGGGEYKIVAKSSETPDEPCVTVGSFCGPSLTPYTFTTDLPIAKDQYIGVEGISSGPDCNGDPEDPDPCTFIGIGPNGSGSEYWDTAPAEGSPATPTGSDTGRLVQADETIGKQVTVSLSSPTITADGLSTTTATATVTDDGTPVSGDDVAITSSDPGQAITPVSDNGDGTYTATITSSETSGAATITATDNTEPSASGSATLTEVAPTITVAVSPETIAADGKSTATATVTLTGVTGEPVPQQSVSVSTDGPASAGPVTDNGDGTYTSVLTSTTTPGDVAVTGADTSVQPNVSQDATLTTAPKVVSLALDPTSITADGNATTTATATVTENGSPVTGDSVAIVSSDSGEKVGAVTDNDDGTYTATITASELVGTPTITATDVSDPALPTGTATLTQGPPTIDVSVSPSSIKADGTSTATATVKLTGVQGEPVTGQDVSITTTGPASAGLVRDNGDGTYTTDITAFHTAGTVTITGADISVDPEVSGTAMLQTKAVTKPSKHHPKKGKCKVPKLTGETVAAAKRALATAKCKVGKVTLKPSKKVRKGRVIASSPKAGTKPKQGTRVNLTVSRGKH
jgi:hypothetical protein